MMMLSLSAKPHKSVNVSTDLMLNSSFDGNFDNNQLSLYLGTNVYSTIKTNFANFGLHAGGIKWYRQSKLTVWAEEGYLRYSLFEEHHMILLRKMLKIDIVSTMIKDLFLKI